MSGPVDPSVVAAQVAKLVADLGEASAPVLEAVEGYRVARVRDGYDDGDARRMAVDYHAGLLRCVFK